MHLQLRRTSNGGAYLWDVDSLSPINIQSYQVFSDMELRPRALVTVEIVVYHDDVFPDTTDDV